MFKKAILAAVAAAAVLASAGSAQAAGNGPEVRKLLRKADQYKQEKDYERAIQVLDQVLAIDPGNADAWAEGAWIFNEQGKYDIAVKAADRALAAESDHSNALREKGYALMKQGKDRDAARLLFASIESDKRNWSSYDYLATALENLGEYKLAKDVRALKKAEMDDDR